MDMKSVREHAREQLKGFCRVCPVCDGRACAGEVPGMGGVGTGSAFKVNLEALAKVKLNMRTIHSVKEPDMSLTLWGRKLSMPILGAPITGSSYNMGGKMTEEEFIAEMVAGAIQAGTLCMTGDGADPRMFDSGLKAGADNKGGSIAIIKPRAQDVVVGHLRAAEATGVLATGMDIDGAGLVTMAMKGQPVGPKTATELREVINATKLPFIVKGVMTADEAEEAVQAGAAAIVVSNHGGRVLDFTPGAAEVLPAIAARVKGKAIIFADGGVRSGADVLKLLALGADAVLVGRPLVIAAFGGGREGVALYLNQLKGELLQAMLLTGTADVKQVPAGILYGRQ
ncbi:FMN-dependent alpha-hydroxy acid dehydrogenase [Desulfobulbus propionicus DSM 2032]|uniref:FMN-dependent alpha-hydroxy acid dehydrogenase n=1 Tax=Desulfobulbus propionicus (strain ATCC 33891 / DSM 2032 / VKM B-1956 / 1pr3) TaxID=577650 RepID=A0A7U4DNA1_DESPD|nr:alpha-hydroxy-acid oxidizing protein [Desulfobulbus propionicus]ADW16891.1 FMN-dependent alpha-hydroxy acid dehydrogenase [Desulfobulbus propionicus DSM 2032]